MKVAFLGLGNMGSAMARNLVHAGNAVTAYNRTPSKAEGIGAKVAASPAEAVEDCEVVVSMLANDEAVEAVIREFNLPAGAIHVSCSTISTALARRLPQPLVCAPVFGRPEAAAAKKLVVIAAGPQDLVERCRPVFEAIGRMTIVAGEEPWQANALKLCGNFMIASMLESFGEAFAVLRKAGVDPQVFLAAMNALFNSPVYENYGKLIANEQYEPAGFALKLGFKDVRLALETAQECVAPMPIASVLRDQFLAALAAGQGEMDWSSVALVAKRATGAEG